MKRNISRTTPILIAIIVIYCAVVTAINPRFLSLETLFSIMKSASGTLILACGVLMVMISGGIDVSFGAIAIFGGYTSLAIAVANGIDSLWVLFTIPVIIGVALGLVNALLVQLLKLDPFVITLGTSSLFHGLMTLVVGIKTIGGGIYPPQLKAFGLLKLFTLKTAEGATIGMPVSLIPAVIVLLLTWFILKHTMLGRGVCAMGCNLESARRAGFKLFKLRLFVYAYAGALAGLMGIIHLANVGTGSPIAIIGDELSVIAAVVIGGTRVGGGKGSILGTILGVIILWLFTSTLIYMGLTSSWTDLFVGAVLLLVVVTTSYRERLRNRKNFVFTE